MTDPPTPTPEEREHAAELYRRARALHDAERYYEARPLYQQSLDLDENPEVLAAYRRLMATIGPM